MTLPAERWLASAPNAARLSELPPHSVYCVAAAAKLPPLPDRRNNRRTKSAPPCCGENNLIFEYILMSRSVCPPRQLLNCMVFRTHNSRLLVLPNSALVAGKDHFHHGVPPKPLVLPPPAEKWAQLKGFHKY